MGSPGKERTSWRNGFSIERPRYDFTQHTYDYSQPKNEAAGSAKVLLIEGLHTLSPFGPQADLRVYMSTPAQTCALGRVARDTASITVGGRGRTREDVLMQLEATVQPACRRFIEPTRENTHVEVNWHVPNETVPERIKANLIARAYQLVARPVYLQITGNQLPLIDNRRISISYLDQRI